MSRGQKADFVVNLSAEYVGVISVVFFNCLS